MIFKRITTFVLVALFSLIPNPDLFASILAAFRKGDNSNHGSLILSQPTSSMTFSGSKHESHVSHSSHESHVSHSSGSSSSSSGGSTDIGPILIGTGVTAGIIYLIYWINKNHVFSHLHNTKKKTKYLQNSITTHSTVKKYGLETYTNEDDSCSICVDLKNPSKSEINNVTVKATADYLSNLVINPTEIVISSILPNQNARVFFKVIVLDKYKKANSKITISFEGDFDFNPKYLVVEIPN